MKKLDTVFIGIGGYGITHLTKALDGKEKDLINICGVVDPYPDTCSRIDDVRALNIPIFSTLEDFYAENKADLAVISTPIQFHAKQIKACMENGSHVLCEKPLCGDEAEIDLIDALMKKTGKRLLIGYQWSTSKAMLDLKKDVLAGVYGKLKSTKVMSLSPRPLSYYARSSGWAGKKYASDGTVIFDSNINNGSAHFLHAMLFMAGSELCIADVPTKISAEIARGNNIENYDTAIVNVTYSNGATGCFVGSHAVDGGVSPIFHYYFENGHVFINSAGAENQNIPEENKTDLVGFRKMVGILNDGRVIEYDSPDDEDSAVSTLELAVKMANGEDVDYCGLHGAAAQTRVINYIQKNCEIYDLPDIYVTKREGNASKGLYELLWNIYENPSLAEGEPLKKFCQK